MIKGCLAIDIGASGGKAFAGYLAKDKLIIEEVYRFRNLPFSSNGHIFWSIDELLDGVVRGIRKASTLEGFELESIGIDTWGVDFGLLDGSGSLLGHPMHYRNMFGTGIMERALKQCGRSWLFDQSPTQFQPFNTLFQLIALREWMPDWLKSAKTLLPMASLLSYLLCGEIATEFTMATTTQLFDPEDCNWSEKILDFFNLPRVMTKIVPAGTQLATLTSGARNQVGCDAKIILPATHDTASAVASIPMSENSMFISSGTWFLEGVVVDKPIRTEEVLENNFTNEGCYDGKYRLLKNVTGLWLIEELYKQWNSASPELDYESLERMAEAAHPLPGVLDVESPLLKKPVNMEKAIKEECANIGTVPETRGQLVRTVLEGIAYKTSQVRRELEQITGNELAHIHIVGGGARNSLLCQLISNHCELEVIAGPLEGTALGNLIVQMLSSRIIGSIEEVHQLVSRSSELKRFFPNT